MPWAYSYHRFSHYTQADGDSLRRQAANRDRWLAANPHAKLDKTLAMTDKARSAFHRSDWETYALAQFVKHVEGDRVEPGSYLLVENLDRLSREDEGVATELFLRIVNRGVVVVQLEPVVVEFRAPVDMRQLMYAVMELSRGHNESKLKSTRVRESWTRRIQAAQAAGPSARMTTRSLPGWFAREPDGDDGKPGKPLLRGGRPVLDPVRADVVRRIYALSVAGRSAGQIAATLAGEGAPYVGRRQFKGKSLEWTRYNVQMLLTSRAVVGEYTPYASSARCGRGHTAGEPIPGYYPAVIDEDTFDAARAGRVRRGVVGRGRPGKHVNLFAGLLTDARGGAMTYSHSDRGSVIIPRNPGELRRGVHTSFPVGAFETAILGRLAEVRAAEIEVGAGDAVRRVDAISGRLGEVKNLIKLWTLKMDDPAIVDTVAAKLAELNGRRKSLAAELSDAQRDADSPLAESLGEIRTLADALRQDNSDDSRTRARAAIRRAVDRVLCLFGGPVHRRLAIVQVCFHGGGRRAYVILHRRGHTSGRRGQQVVRPADTVATSFKRPDMPDGLDLSRPEHRDWAVGVLGALRDEMQAKAPPRARPRLAKTPD